MSCVFFLINSHFLITAEKTNDLLDIRACMSSNTLTWFLIYDSLSGFIIPQAVYFAFAVYFIFYIRQSKRQMKALKTSKRTASQENNHLETSNKRNTVSIARSNTIAGPSVDDKEGNINKSNIAAFTADDNFRDIPCSNKVLSVHPKSSSFQHVDMFLNPGPSTSKISRIEKQFEANTQLKTTDVYKRDIMPSSIEEINSYSIPTELEIDETSFIRQNNDPDRIFSNNEPENMLQNNETDYKIQNDAADNVPSNKGSDNILSKRILRNNVPDIIRLNNQTGNISSDNEADNNLSRQEPENILSTNEPIITLPNNEQGNIQPQSGPPEQNTETSIPASTASLKLQIQKSISVLAFSVLYIAMNLPFLIYFSSSRFENIDSPDPSLRSQIRVERDLTLNWLLISYAANILVFYCTNKRFRNRFKGRFRCFAQ